MYPNEDFGADVVLVSPTSSNKRDRLLPPQAYPNFMEESLVLASVQKNKFESDPFLLFLLYHEIEHCTIPAVRLEAEPYRLLILATVSACAFFLAANVNSIAAVYCALYFLLLVVEANIFIPAQIEARTDLRALARLNKKDLKTVLEIRDLEYQKKLGQRDDPIFRRFFRPGTLAIFIQSCVLAGAKGMGESEERWFVSGDAKRPPRSRGLEGLGNRSLFGALIAFPAASLMYMVASNTNEVQWAGAYVYFLAAPGIYVASAAIGVKAEGFRQRRKHLLDQLERD